MVGTAAMLLAQQGDISINLDLAGILALVAGILILIFPTVLNYIVAAYLIITGLILIFDIRV